MKFKVHLFREYLETYEVEADNAEAALNLVEEDPPAPIQTETLGYLSHALVDPILPDGSVDYANSVWRE